MERLPRTSIPILLIPAFIVSVTPSTAPARSALQATPDCSLLTATIVGTPGDDELSGTKGNDIIFAGAGNDIVYADVGHDIVCAGPGNDLVQGGIGKDRISGGSGLDELWGEGDKDDLRGGPDADKLRGQGDEDRLSGGPGEDVLEGDGYDDLLTGGPDRDEVDGGRGRDRISFASRNRRVWIHMKKNQGGGDIWIKTEGIVGTRFDDTIIGGKRGNDLIGGDGDDKLLGGPGHYDLLNGGQGNDTLRGGSGSGLDEATYAGAKQGVFADLDRGIANGTGHDSLAGIENLRGSAHDDRLFGNKGNNRIEGGPGNDLIRAGKGDYDTIGGGAGADTIMGGEGYSDTAMFCCGRGVNVDLRAGTARGQGLDRLSGFEEVWGSAYDDVIYGSEFDDTLYDNSGVDRLFGRDGDDWLESDHPRDFLDGGPGNDDLCTQPGRKRHCESTLHGDYAFPIARIVWPTYGRTLARESFREIGGRFEFGFSSLSYVEVALRRVTSTGCRWWGGRPRRFVPGACLNKSWFKAKVRGYGWEATFSRPLPRDRYLAYVRTVPERGSPSDWDDQVRFSIR